MKILKKLLLLISTLGLIGCSNVTVTSLNYIYTNAENYVAYESPTTIDIQESGLNELDIDWISGEVVVKYGEEVKIEETSSNGTYYPLYYYQQGSSLLIRYCASGTFFFRYNDTAKKLEVTIPHDISTLKVATVSANYKVYLSNVNNVNLETVSGNGEVSLESTNSIKIATVSGQVEGNINEVGLFDAATVSGSVSMISNKTRKIDFDTVSANLNYTIKDTSTLEMIEVDSVSGTVNLTMSSLRGYNLLEFKTNTGERHSDFKDGDDDSLPKFDIKFSSVSGNLNIKKYIAE